MWRELISRSFADAKFSAPATLSEVERAERALGVSFPPQLRLLLLETNGVAAHYSSPLVWPVEEIISQNQLFRTKPEFAELYMPFDCLLFFGAEGNGDQFAYRILNGRIPETSWIYEWDHEGDDRVWFARDLADYFGRSVPKDE
ncbi:MAG: SMI1/KNR4 family protein [Gemmatimonadaceae bacterium]